MVWLCAADFEARHEAFTRSRTLLQKARIKIKDEPDLWTASIELEIKTGNVKIA
jgi:hypothetical protein